MIKTDGREREGSASQCLSVVFPFVPLRFLEIHVRPRLHRSGQIFARTRTCTVPPCVHTGQVELKEYLNG